MGSTTLLLILIVPSCLLVLYYIRTKNAERIKLIEKGINPDEGFGDSNHSRRNNLKNGIFFISMAIGLLIGNFLAKNNILEGSISYISMLLLFGGLSFFVNYMIAKN